MCAHRTAGSNGVTVFAAAATPLDPPEKPSVVTVPTGVTTVVLNGEVTQQIACDVVPNSMLRVEMTLVDGNSTRVTGRFVVPKVLVFVNTNASGEFVKQSQRFTIFGRTAGRFYLTYALSGDAELYKLSAVSSVISIVEESQGWQGIWYELGFNVALFTAGMLFFVWRRMHQLELPIWKGHQAGLFERANYDDLEPSLFNDKYREIMGATVRQRMNIFLSLPTHGSYMCHTCGIPAALNLQFHVDAGHLFSVLTFFSIAVMLPVNYLSGKSTTSVGGSNSFQQTTFSNVPLHSNWYWAHVAYCYLVAGCVLAFIVRQSRLASTLQKRTKRIVGARSILIHHGLPPHFSSKKLRAILRDNYFPTGVDEVTVIDDLTQVHSILHRRRELSDQLDRMRMLDACYEHGTLSWNLLFCPGSVLAPSPTEVLSSYFCCKPCRYAYRHERITHCVCPKDKRKPLPALYSSVKSDREIWDPRAKSAIQSLDDELDFFPEEALRVYNNRKCMGAAFIVFESSAKRNEFVRLVRAHSWSGKILNAVDACSYSRQDRDDDNLDERNTSLAKENTSNELVPYLSKLVLTSAPEPDDIIWMNLKYRPYSFTGALGFLARQFLTTGLLLLFSSPTAVLVYMKLDSSSELYQDLENRHSFLVTLVVSYLPSLLLITVNWFLLAFLYYVTMTEPSISESRRTNIFLIKGFIYLVMSSVLLPSIGITAVYLAVSGVEKSGHTYVETFLYKVSGTFFISYICQRTFLGAVMDITRSAERSAYQPWVLSRSVTEEEKRFNKKPWPYFYGHDYALILSVFMMILLGTVITPILTPFGALYFYLKFFTTKYNFLYVMPYSPGRGHIAQTAVTIAFVCLILFEFTMAFVFLQVAGRRQFTAMIVLSSCTVAFYVMRISGMSAVVQRRLSRDRAKRRAAAASKDDKAVICEQGQGKGRTVLSSPPTSLDQELRLKETYADPYKVALSIFKLLGVNQFHQMTSRRTQLTYALYRLRRHAKMAAKESASSDAPAHSRPGKGQHDLV
ncbi:Csc1 protein 1, partial [Globisporangium splendens]